MMNKFEQWVSFFLMSRAKRRRIKKTQEKNREYCSYPCIRFLNSDGSVIRGLSIYLNRPAPDPESMYQELLSVLLEKTKDKIGPIPVPLLFGVREYQSSKALIEKLESFERVKTRDGRQLLKVTIDEIGDTVSIVDWLRTITEELMTVANGVDFEMKSISPEGVNFNRGFSESQRTDNNLSR